MKNIEEKQKNYAILGKFIDFKVDKTINYEFQICGMNPIIKIENKTISDIIDDIEKNNVYCFIDDTYTPKIISVGLKDGEKYLYSGDNNIINLIPTLKK